MFNELLLLIKKPFFQRTALVLAWGSVFVGVWYSLQQYPHLLQSLDWVPALYVLFLGVPFTIFLNSSSYQLSARLVNHEVDWKHSVDIAVIGTVANQLPVPGALAVRVGGLKARGVSFKEGMRVTLKIAFNCLGMGFVWGGAWLLAVASQGLGSALILSGFLVWLVSGVMIYRRQKSVLLWVSVLGLCLVVTDTLRLLLCLKTLGVEISFAQSAVLSVSGMIATAVGFAPGGVGVREYVAAGLTVFVGLEPEQGLLAIILNRLLDLGVMLPLSLFLLKRMRTAQE